jgi:valyl-tRNA synthetase
MIEKTFAPAEVEARIAALWETSGAFRAMRPERLDAAPYCIVIPPPNVTGSLHMGHALNNTLQDVLCRFERMRGRDVLWQPGTDHAGIATQMVVERKLAAEGKPDRRTMGREAFLKAVWDWKAESGSTITNQLKRLGASCDWSRERFTMDEGLSKAVIKVFVELYRAGLIYKDKRLVNWDTTFETAISDLEVENREVNGQMWHFKYPLADGETYDYVERDSEGNITLSETRDYISIATTRPETMLGDGAVAVHPSDERYAPIIGKLCEIPVGPKEHRRLIPIIVDDYPDPTFGSGAVKITGAHDANDYGVARRNGIPMYRLMDTRGRLRADGEPYAFEAAKAREIVERGVAPDPQAVDEINLVPDAYRGLDRFEARARVVADIDAEGLMIKVETKKIMQPFGDRSNTVIEPMLTDQWFANAAELARPAIAAVRDGRTAFVPQNWENTYFEWMENIQPWCVSRQLWWGHQIPAWYGPDGKVFVALDEDEALAEALAHYVTTEAIEPAEATAIAEDADKRATFLTRDEDVLDTWFSSALWPFSTLGWPDDTPALKRFYKTDVLVTGFDIIFFWVARMMMTGLHFMDDVPFHTVYIHALVRDEKGQKMSKSKGNVIDPLDLIDAYGADALRFTLAAMAAQGRDIKLARSRVEGYRNFGTKLWNAARFAEMNGCKLVRGFDATLARETLNRWIGHETARASAEITAAIEAYRFNEAAGAAYRFVWNIVCDWYLELAKPVLTGPDSPAKTETQAMIAWVIDEASKLLHPFMPFITEELWGVTGEGQRQQILALTSWPTHEGLDAPDAEAEIGWLIDLVTAIRSLRVETNVPAGAQVPLVMVGISDDVRARIGLWLDMLKRLARLSDVSFADQAPRGAAQIVVRGDLAALPLGDIIDLAAERVRITKELGKIDQDIAKIDAKLGNADFIKRAPEEVIEEQRERREAASERRTKLLDALERLAQAG